MWETVEKGWMRFLLRTTDVITSTELNYNNLNKILYAKVHICSNTYPIHHIETGRDGLTEFVW